MQYAYANSEKSDPSLYLAVRVIAEYPCFTSGDIYVVTYPGFAELSVMDFGSDLKYNWSLSVCALFVHI